MNNPLQKKDISLLVLWRIAIHRFKQIIDQCAPKDGNLAQQGVSNKRSMKSYLLVFKFGTKCNGSPGYLYGGLTNENIFSFSDKYAIFLSYVYLAIHHSYRRVSMVAPQRSQRH